MEETPRSETTKLAAAYAANAAVRIEAERLATWLGEVMERTEQSNRLAAEAAWFRVSESLATIRAADEQLRLSRSALIAPAKR